MPIIQIICYRSQSIARGNPSVYLTHYFSRRFIDLILSITSSDSAYRTLSFACSTHNTSITNNSSHDKYLLEYLKDVAVSILLKK